MVEGVRAPGMDKVALTAGETDYPSHAVEKPCARNPVKPETRRSNRPRVVTDLFTLNLFMLKVAGEGTGRGQIGNAASMASQVVKRR